MFQRNEMLKALTDELYRRRLRNPQYSLRSFSRYLGLSAGSLSEILRGKRPLTEKQIDGLKKKLVLPSAMRDEANEPSTYLSDDEFKTISCWYHFGIVNLFETDFPPASTKEISQRLGITILQASAAVQRLAKLGLIVPHKNFFRATGKWISTTHDVANLALRKFHSDILEKAQESLQNDPVNLRDVTNISMAIDLEKLPEAKEEIKIFRRKLAALLSNGRKQTVYNLSIQLFPLEKGSIHDTH